MNQRRSPRYGLTIDTGTTRPKVRSSRPSSTKSIQATSPQEKEEMIRNAIDIIDRFEKSQSPRSPSSKLVRSPLSGRNSRQKRDDVNISVGGSNGRTDNFSTPDRSNVQSSASPLHKFFNCSTTQSPRCDPKRPFDESPINDKISLSKREQIVSSPRRFFDAANPTTPKSRKSQQELNNRVDPSTCQSRSPKKQSSLQSPKKLSHTSSSQPQILPSPSSTSSKLTSSHVQRLLANPAELTLRPRKKQLDEGDDSNGALNVVCNEEGFEVQQWMNTLETGVVYRNKRSVRYGLDGVLPELNIETNQSTADDSECTNEAGEVGGNGWHRLLSSLQHNNFNQHLHSNNQHQSNNTHNNVNVSAEHKSTLTTNQLSSIHILQHSLVACEEYEALREERMYLLNELKALEKDRVCLERMFLELDEKRDGNSNSNNIGGGGVAVGGSGGGVGGAGMRRGGNIGTWQYKDFKQNIHRVTMEEWKYLPILWLEDLLVGMEDTVDNLSSKKNGKSLRRKKSQDEKFTQDIVERIKHSRGNGLALLLADGHAKNSIIGRCYMNGIGQVRNHRLLSVEGPAILIPNGGCGVLYFGVLGCQNLDVGASHTALQTTDSGGKDVGTSYFIKFDGGKSYHRGMLPSNLADRLIRDNVDPRTIRYLSTGQSSDGGTSYYAEFDNGECWWGTPHQDDDLHSTFMEMDVHRVAFGVDSWIVLGKDGNVVWKNIPQGLHDVLTGREAAACEVSLGIGGSYFVRFLDGQIEYSLPSFVADVCERLEAKGQVIRYVSLSVDTYDCVIRYSAKELE